MRFMPLTACAIAATLGVFLALPLSAQTPDVFAFIPVGGRTLLTDVANSHPPAAELKALLTGKHSREEWVSYLKDHGQAIPALQRLSEKEALTLADYLSFNMPLPAGQVPADPAKAVLPPDGRDITMDRCQGCHIITVVVTQDRAKAQWLGTMHKPSHIGIKITEQQREAVAGFLVINAGIPIEQVPEELRAGGATY